MKVILNATRNLRESKKLQKKKKMPNIQNGNYSNEEKSVGKRCKNYTPMTNEISYELFEKPEYIK